MHAATIPEWLTAAVIGTTGLIPFAVAVRISGHDFHATAKQIEQWAGLQAAALLLVLAWHLETREATR